MIVHSTESRAKLLSIGLNLETGVNLEGRGLLGYGCKITDGGGLRYSCLGAYSYIHPFFIGCQIGNYCSYARYASLAYQHPIDRLTTSTMSYFNNDNEMFFGKFQNRKHFPGVLPTIIGHDVWIGIYSSIKTGVHIGNCAIIGAGAVVTKDVPDFSIVGGVPAKTIRMRFSDAICERIQKNQWFLYDWAGFDIDWSNIDHALDQVDQYLAETKVPYPRLFAYNAEGKGLQLQEIKNTGNLKIKLL